MLLIGSRALTLNCSKYRKIHDIDYIVTLDEFKEIKNEFIRNIKTNPGVCYPTSGNHWVIKYKDNKIPIEYEIAYEGSSSADILKYLDVKHMHYFQAPVEILYLLKMSHKFLKNSPHFYKTMNDIKFMRKHFPDEVYMFEHSDVLQEIFKKRENETYKYNHPNLNQKKKDFFSNDNITYKYDHDELHKIVAVWGKPAYLKYKHEDKDVLCSEEKFFNLEYNSDRITGVYEEAAVLALERSIIPFGTDPAIAFKYALMKVCTSITSGWFREFAYDNYDEVLFFAADCNYCFIDVFNEAVKNGKLKPRV